MLTVAIPKRNKLQNIIVLTPKDGFSTFNNIILFNFHCKAYFNLIQRHDIRKAWKFVKYYRKISHSVLLFPFIRQKYSLLFPCFYFRTSFFEGTILNIFGV